LDLRAGKKSAVGCVKPGIKNGRAKAVGCRPAKLAQKDEAATLVKADPIQ